MRTMMMKPKSDHHRLYVALTLSCMLFMSAMGVFIAVILSSFWLFAISTLSMHLSFLVLRRYIRQGSPPGNDDE